MNNKDYGKKIRRRILRSGNVGISFSALDSFTRSNLGMKLGIVFNGIYLAVSKIFLKLRLLLISRLFWGRSASYKNFAHILILFISAVISITGIAYQFSGGDSVKALSEEDEAVGTTDLLLQGGSIQSVLRTNSDVASLGTTQYTVQDSDTLQTIADKYEVTKDTIRWANRDLISAFTDEIQTGWVITIPELNGVLYEVKAGQTLDSIIADASIGNEEANRFNIIEFNNLSEPYTFQGGETLFIPDGNLKQTFDDAGIVADIPRGVFTDPLTHPDCAGYTYSRGFLSYHDGLDLAKLTGCPISAVANGNVTYAGWSPAGQGYMVAIDHGGGISTEYFHGNGTFWVKTGDFVRQGDPIMYMGCTGYCTGPHVHFILKKNGVAINPEGFVPHIKYGFQV